MLPPLSVGQNVTGTVFEKDAQGNLVPVNPANITAKSSDESIVSVVVNGDGTVTASALAPGSATETIGDSQYSLSDPEAVTVGDTPTSIGVEWGEPGPAVMSMA